MNGKAEKVTPIRRYRNGVLIHEAEVVKFGPVFDSNKLLVTWWDRWFAGTNMVVPDALQIIARPGSGKTRGGM